MERGIGTFVGCAIYGMFRRPTVEKAIRAWTVRLTEYRWVLCRARVVQMSMSSSSRESTRLKSRERRRSGSFFPTLQSYAMDMYEYEPAVLII